MTAPLPRDLADSFPSPREDEPASLRRDIIDELADHLACTALREQHRNPNPSQIQQAVLNRFGNPNQIARQLWRDAMWEKIMTQRILIATCGLAMLLSFGLAAVVWQAVQQNQQFQKETIATLQEMVTQLRADQQKDKEAAAAAIAELKRSEEKQTQNAPPSEWNPVEFIFVKGSEDGPPAENVHVRMALQDNGSGLPPLNATSDSRGIVRFPQVRYGVYQVTFLTEYSPETRRGDETLERLQTIPIGKPFSERVICPLHRTHPQQVSVRCDWPEDLKSLSTAIAFSAADIISPSPGGWRPFQYQLFNIAERNSWTTPEKDVCLVTSTGKLFSVQLPPHDSRSRRDRPVPTPTEIFSEIEGIASLNWPDPEYRIENIEVLFIPTVPRSFQFRDNARRPAFPRDQRIAQGLFLNPRTLTIKEVLAADSPFRDLNQLISQKLSESHSSQNPNSQLRQALIEFQFVSGVTQPSDCRIEPGDPATLVITPPNELVEKLRTFAKECEERLAKAKVAAREDAAKSEPPVATPTETPK